MPRVAIKNEFELKTRSEYTKVDCIVTIDVSGRELPTMAVLGDALQIAIAMIQNKVTEAYAKVPERTTAPAPTTPATPTTPMGTGVNA